MERILINKVSLNFNKVVYVDELTGDDILGNGSKSKPYRTIKIAVDNIISGNGEALFLLSDITTNNYFTEKSFSIIGNKKTWNIKHGYDTAILFGNCSIKIYQLVMDFSVGVSQWAYFGREQSCRLELHNCVFIKTSVYPFVVFNVHFSQASYKFINCLTHSGTTVIHPNYASVINTATTTDEAGHSLAKVEIDSEFNILSSGWKNSGTGTNPDGSQANIGIYGGDFTWKTIKTLSLIKTDGIIKKLTFTGQLVDTLLTEPLTQLDFEVHGISDLSRLTQMQWESLGTFKILTLSTEDEGNLQITVPPYTLLDGLENPKLLFYTKNGTPIVKTKSLPNRQIIRPKKDIQLAMLQQVNNITLMSNVIDGGRLRVIVSGDEGLTWKTYNTITAKFVDINIENIDSVRLRGIDTSTFNSIGNQWNDIIEGSKLRFAYYLEIENMTDKSEIDKITINMDMMGRWKEAHHPTDYDYEYDNLNLYFTFNRSGNYKINHAE